MSKRKIRCQRCGHKNDRGNERCLYYNTKLYESLDAFLRLFRPLRMYYFSFDITHLPNLGL